MLCTNMIVTDEIVISHSVGGSTTQCKLSSVKALLQQCQPDCWQPQWHQSIWGGAKFYPSQEGAKGEGPGPKPEASGASVLGEGAATASPLTTS